MFSPKIVASDAFLDMPTSSRELYFQLGMYADDDGFINPRKIIRMVGASEDDLKVLIAKRFVLPFENGVVVIKHWAINNLIRKDWYQETIYTEQKKLLKVKENGAYTESVNEMLTIRPRRLGKVRLGKESIDKNTKKEGEVAILQIATPSQEASTFFTNLEKQREVTEFLIGRGIAEEVARREVEKFVLYWTEPNGTGKKQRWQMEKVFDVKRRFITWIGRVRDFNKIKEKKGITI